jgi:hypothetical protein
MKSLVIIRAISLSSSESAHGHARAGTPILTRRPGAGPGPGSTKFEPTWPWVNQHDASHASPADWHHDHDDDHDDPTVTAQMA